MEIRLDSFSAPSFDVKAWVNEQLAELDGASAFDDETSAADKQSADALTQRLTTQLHFLATNAQQGNDRIKARFRHQATQLTRDISALTKLVQETQESIAEFSATVDARAQSAQAVQRIVDIDVVRTQLERTVVALDNMRSYSNLPQKIAALVGSGELSQAWDLVDGVERVGGSKEGVAGANTDAIKGFREQLTLATTQRLSEAVVAHNAEHMVEAARLLSAHGLSDTIRATYLKQRLEIGAGVVRSAIAEHVNTGDGDLHAVLNVVSDLLSQERAFIEAAGMQSPESLLEAVFEGLLELVVPTIQSTVRNSQQAGAAADSGSDILCTIDTYRLVTAFYADVLNVLESCSLSVGDSTAEQSALLARPVPKSLELLLEPFVPCMDKIAKAEFVRIRAAGLAKLKGTDLDYRRTGLFIREASQAMREIFVDIEQAVERMLDVLPASMTEGIAASAAELVDDISAWLVDKMSGIAEHAGVSLSELNDYAQLVPPKGGKSPKAKFESAVYQTLSAGPKLESVSSVIGVAVLTRLLEQFVAALSESMAKHWSEALALVTSLTTPARLLVAVCMESCNTPAELAEKVSRIAVSPEGLPLAAAQRFNEAVSRASHVAASVSFFMLTSAFRPPLSRIARLGVWHEQRTSKSSMNVEVPQFSCSPSEEAVDIGEKMHILLPELEQIDTMDAQFVRGAELEGVVPPLYNSMLAWLRVDSGLQTNQYQQLETESMMPVLCHVLEVVLQNMARQLCLIKAPLSGHGKLQLVADVEYVASVVSSFTALSSSVEFEEVVKALKPDSDAQDDAASSSNTLAEALAVRAKMRALLAE
ncbi:hypothetical protein H4218_002222 [Coemansia sp. IMI 209128]|nr:hypothetical protein GGI10_003801 [Coemansia sp. RSA 2530]KAJ2700138.1 hypothetical protein H4218_002222 [Coemansia sp. IMI 209128]